MRWVSVPARFELLPDARLMYSDCVARYKLYPVFCDIPVHTHAYFIIPLGVIDGQNREFSVSGKRFAVLLNGLQIPYMRTLNGFVLSEAPLPGDYLWCEVVL